MNNLRKEREEQGLTIKELAEKIGVHFTTISDWELEKTIPRPKKRNEIAEVLGIDKKKLFPDLYPDLETNLPKAEYAGTLRIGDIKIPCAVLEDGTRVLSEHGITTALKSRSGAARKHKKHAIETGRPPLPIFVASKNLIPFISDELYIGLTEPLRYEVGNRIAQGFPAELLPEICDVWLKARDNNVLNKQQEKKCKQAEILVRGLAHVGIIALVDEATGYQEVRSRNALEEILDKFIAKELRKWIKTFPDEFYIEMFRLRGWQYIPFSVKRPSVVGKYTNDLIYERLAPNVLEELKKKNPKDIKGRRKHKHFQWLTEDVGDPRLREHLSAVIALMKASTKWDQFYRMVQRALPKYREQIPLDFEEFEKNDE